MVKKSTTAAAERKAAEFNRRFPLGTSVRYWTGERYDETGKEGVIKHEATVLGGHTAVAWIDTCRGCVAITHVEKQSRYERGQKNPLGALTSACFN